jgi:hypothetical protein
MAADRKLTGSCTCHHPPGAGGRPGFFLGDGAGVGKGRQIAALTKECWNQGVRRILWVSTSTDLKYDAERDLADVGAAHIPVFPEVRPRGGRLAALLAKAVYMERLTSCKGHNAVAPAESAWLEVPTLRLACYRAVRGE